MFKNSTAVCFVCGNFAQEENMSKLYSRNSHSRVDASFFPFLEYHDPAPGADPMKDDWSVISCSVCSCLLSQQWKSFERSKMPINKRLYWLKRPSGCEIRQPVSQVWIPSLAFYFKITFQSHFSFILDWTWRNFKRTFERKSTGTWWRKQFRRQLGWLPNTAEANTSSFPQTETKRRKTNRSSRVNKQQRR